MDCISDVPLELCVTMCQDYRERYLALERSQAQASKADSINVLGPHTPLHGPDPPAVEPRRHSKPSSSGDTSTSNITLVSSGNYSGNNQGTNPKPVPPIVTGTNGGPSTIALRISASRPSTAQADSELLCPSVILGNGLPFRDECMRIIATFFRPEASKELNLDAALKDDVLRNLDHSTHPDIVGHLLLSSMSLSEPG
jgi:hypothetical protein